jgi:undecaprenyl diphosphate synthase
MQSDLPQVIGWEAQRAEKELTARGWRVLMKSTSPPRGGGRGPDRVIRQKLLSENTLELTVAAHPPLAESEVPTSPASPPASPLPAEGEAAPAETSEQAMASRVDPARLPRHIAIIMDGNGRWAKQRELPRIMGHRAGQTSVRKIVRAASDLGIKYLTLYTFSTENWVRPAEEISALMDLIYDTLREDLQQLHEEGVRVRALGRVAGLPEKLQEIFRQAEAQTKNNAGLNLNVAINYSGRAEIADAARKLAAAAARGELAPEAIDETTFAAALYLPEIPDPELLIRTSGERRVSNYLLWQIAYSELYITPVLWPDFRRIHLLEAILDYQQRQRRFGAIQ